MYWSSEIFFFVVRFASVCLSIIIILIYNINGRSVRRHEIKPVNRSSAKLNLTWWLFYTPIYIIPDTCIYILGHINEFDIVLSFNYNNINYTRRARMQYTRWCAPPCTVFDIINVRKSSTSFIISFDGIIYRIFSS